MARATLLIVLAVFALAAPSAALAAGSGKPVPSSNPVANQYSEMVPMAGGNTPSGGIHAGTGAKSPLPSRVVRRLNTAGSAGKAAAGSDAAVAQAGLQQAKHASHRSRNPSHHRSTTPNNGPRAPSSAATAQVLKTLGGSTGGGGGLGILLPAILVISLVAASVAGVLRRRGAS